MATPTPLPSTPTNESSSINADTIISKIKGITEKINALKVNMQQRIQTMQTQLEASTQSSDEESQRLQGEIIKLNEGLENTTIENSELKAELAKLEAINSELTTLEGKVQELIDSNANTEQQGGYQYKSKSKNNTRSKRIIKLNKFGLLKSRSKTNKKSKKIKKKPLKSKLKRRVKGKSVKKGGAKKKKSHTKTKKHLKSKRSRRRHK